MVVLLQLVPRQPGTPDRHRQGHLVEIGAAVRGQRLDLVDGLRGLHPGLGKGQALRAAVVLGEDHEPRGEIGHHGPPAVAHQPDPFPGDGHAEGAVDRVPQVVRFPVDRGGGRAGDMAGLHQPPDVMCGHHQDVAVHEARPAGFARLKAGDDLVSMGIFGIEDALRLHRPDLAAHPAERLDRGGVDLSHAVGGAVADQLDRGVEVLADRGGEVAGEILVARRFDHEEQGERGGGHRAPPQSSSAWAGSMPTSWHMRQA